LLFGESQSRVVLSVRPTHCQTVLRRAGEAGVEAAVIGTVGGERLVIDVEAGKRAGGCRIDADLQTLVDRWGNSLERLLEGE
jgi:phosphoribosylformylglycinamidine synthase